MHAAEIYNKTKEEKMVCFGRIGVTAAAVICAAVTLAFGGEIDLLVDKLVEKGVLTQGEAQQLITETKEEVRQQNAAGNNESLPKWIQNTKFSGDVRIRYQGETKTGSKHRDRGRFRLRYGFDTKANDQMKVGFRMASGENKTSGPEQTSTNQSFTNMFQNKHVWIDRAFVEYTPFSQTDVPFLKDMKLVGGKFANPFYTTDVVWDGDINPEGGYIAFTPVIATLNTFMTFGFLPLGESSSDSNDPMLYAIQIGAAPKLAGRDSKFAIGLYSYDNIKGMPWNNYSANYTPTINNTLDGTNLKYDYDIFELVGEYSPLDIDIFGSSLPFAMHGTWVSNVAKRSAGETNAWMAGLKLGKVKDKGTYELFYNYRQIGQDAVLATINDSDFHLGGTAAKGHKFGCTYAIMPNSTIGLNYMITDPYRSYQTGTSKHIDVYQLDWVTKF